MKPNTLATFYEALAPVPESAAGVVPPDMGPGVGHFNVFLLAELRRAPPMTFSRRDYYKITLCRGRSQVECADQASHVGDNTLVSGEDARALGWLPPTEDFACYSCLFDDALLLPTQTG